MPIADNPAQERKGAVHGWMGRSATLRMYPRRVRRGHRSSRAVAVVAPMVALLIAHSGLALAQSNLLATQVAQARSMEDVHIALAATMSVNPGAHTPLQLRIVSRNDPPKNSIVRVRGLPPTISLSDGYATAPGAWDVPLKAVPNLQMNIPAGISGRSEIRVSLVGEDGLLLAEATSVLTVQPELALATPPREQEKASPPADQATVPVISAAERETAEKFLSRGERELEQGNIAGARQLLLRAAQIGLARAAMLLAATYDPGELARWRVQGVQPNLAEARKWYERALELGAPDAKERLARLHD
jgi:hypothetical protein